MKYRNLYKYYFLPSRIKNYKHWHAENVRICSLWTSYYGWANL